MGRDRPEKLNQPTKANSTNKTMKNSKEIDQTRQQLKSYLDNPGDGMKPISINGAARSMGVSTSALSQFLNDKYEGDNEKLAGKVKGWLKRQEERRNYNEILTETIMTRAVKKIQQVARLCHIERDMGVATGDAGVGKTRGCKYYSAKNKDVILVRAHVGYTTKALMGKIHEEVGLSGHGSVFDMFNGVVERLRDSGRLIIVDEAENLPYKAHELLRSIYDHAGIGILLCGMPRLISILRGNKGEYKQLYSRIGVHARIPDMKEYPEDVQALVKNAMPQSNGVWKAFHEVTHNARQIEKLLKRSMQVADRNETKVTAEVVKNAKQYIII